MRKKKIGIIGVGFMGGSFAKAIKEKFPHVSLWGYARSNSSYYRLKRLKILDKVERDLRKVVEDADFVVLATPIYAIVDYLRKISPYLKKGAVVFDLGSTKELIEKSASKLLSKDVHFVGCHPLCGSEKSGAVFSRAQLFRNSICIITASPSKKSTQYVKKIWKKLGCKVIFISSSQHDKILSSVSHLPHLISFSLTYSVPSSYGKYSSSSLRDLTRISGSPASVWGDIFLSNAKNILKDLDKFIENLNKFKRLIKNKEKKKIIKLIEEINLKQRVFNSKLGRK
jgi:prephenate dehydrogenase